MGERTMHSWLTCQKDIRLTSESHWLRSPTCRPLRYFSRRRWLVIQYDRPTCAWRADFPGVTMFLRLPNGRIYASRITAKKSGHRTGPEWRQHESYGETFSAYGPNLESVFSPWFMVFSGVIGTRVWRVACHKDSVFMKFLASWLGLISLGEVTGHWWSS